MKKVVYMIGIGLLVMSGVALANQVETEPVTQKQFEAVQKKQKAKAAKRKTPNILPANTYTANSKAYAEKKFHVKVIGDGIINLDSIGGGACGFYLVASQSDGFKDSGSGTYYLTSKNKNLCGDLMVMKGSDISSMDLIVQFKRPVDFQLKNGVIGKAAGFKIIRRH